MATTTATAESTEESSATPTKTLLIDTDVHEYMRSKTDLLPYLDDYWQHVMKTHRFDKAPYIPSAMPYAPPQTARAEWILEDNTYGTDVGHLQSHLLEGEGVTTAILNGFFYSSAMAGNFEMALAYAKAYNDWQVDQWLDKEPSLRGSIHVVTNDPAASVEEIDRMAEHPQMVQVFLPSVTDRQYGDPYYRPIFEAAARNDLVVALHHGNMSQTAFGFPRYYLEWHTLAAPEAAFNQLMSLIANGVFDALPELKVVFLETGVAWLPWFMWRADEQYNELRTDIPWVKKRPSDHIRDSVRIATQPLGDIKARDLLKIVDMVESEDIFLFASDYPHYDADTADIVLGPMIPDELSQKIRYRNAIETFPRLAGLDK